MRLLSVPYTLSNSVTLPSAALSRERKTPLSLLWLHTSSAGAETRANGRSKQDNCFWCFQGLFALLVYDLLYNSFPFYVYLTMNKQLYHKSGAKRHINEEVPSFTNTVLNSCHEACDICFSSFDGYGQLHCRTFNMPKCL